MSILVVSSYNVRSECSYSFMVGAPALDSFLREMASQDTWDGASVSVLNPSATLKKGDYREFECPEVYEFKDGEVYSW